MSDRPWYKRYGADFVHGTLGLTLEEKGAYSLCLDLIYDRGGPIPDDARWLAGVCGVSVRKWNTIRSRLIETGKIVERDGFLINDRAEKEIENAAKTSRKHAENGSKGGNKRAENASDTSENKGLGQARLKHRAPVQKPEARYQKEEAAADSPPVAPRASDGMDLDELERLLRGAAGMEQDPSPGLLDLSPIVGLIDQGFDLKREILPTVRAIAGRKQGKPKSWRYFVSAVVESRANNLRLIEGGAGPPPDPDEERRKRLAYFERHGEWHHTWGPRPRIAKGE